MSEQVCTVPGITFNGSDIIDQPEDKKIINFKINNTLKLKTIGSRIYTR